MKKILFLAAAILSLTACNNEVNNIDDPVEAQITATISNNGQSRASASSWAENDCIGVYMEGRYFNIKYTTPGGDGFFEGNKMYFKNKIEPVKLYAYYPFSGMEGTVLAGIDASTTAENQTSCQSDFDFLYAVKENVTGTNPAVQFDFSHKMSQITLIFKNGDGMDVGNIASYEINGLVLDGTFYTTSGNCSIKSDATPAPITMTLSEGSAKNNEALPSLIVFPQEVAQPVSLTITDNEGQEFACELSFSGKTLVSGNNYEFKITLNKTGLIVNQSTIVGWKTENGDDMSLS